MTESPIEAVSVFASKRLLVSPLLFLTIGASAEPDAQWEASVEPSMNTGDCGTGTRPTAYDMPLSMRRFFSDGEVGRHGLRGHRRPKRPRHAAFRHD